MLYSVKVQETSDIIYDKVNLRLQHLTSLSTDASKKESEEMMV